MKKLLLSLAFFLTACTTYAANIYSTNTGGNWSNPATWVGGVVPAAADFVYIEAGATVVLDVNATIDNLRFNAAYPAIGTLQISDAVTPKILTVNQILISSFQNSWGQILVSGAEHEIHTGSLGIYNLTEPVGTVLVDMPVGKLVLDIVTGGNVTLAVSNVVAKVKTMEIGDGIIATNFNFNGNIPTYPNGRVIVKNNANFVSTNISFGNEPTSSLVVKNGGTFVSNAGPLTSNGGLNMNLGENDADIVNGNYIQYMNLRRFLTNDTYTMPPGKYGNVIFEEATESGAGLNQYKSCNKLIRVTGSGVRTVKILGNFTLRRNVTNATAGANQTHPDVYFEGGLNSADCANVTWEFAGNGKNINIGRDANLAFMSIYAGANSSTQPKIKISGNVTINHVVNNPQVSNTAYFHSLYFYHLDVTNTGDLRFGPSAVVPMPSAGSPAHHKTYILGNMNIDGTVDFAKTFSNIFYFDNREAASYSGSGTLHVSKLLGRVNGTAANATKITSSLNQIFFEPDMAFQWNTTANPTNTYLFYGDYTWFEAIAGTFRIDNKDYVPNGAYGYADLMIVPNAIGINHRINFHSLRIEDSTLFQINNTFENSATSFLKVGGDINMMGAYSEIFHEGNNNTNNTIEFNGTGIQNLNAFDSLSFRFHNIKINNPTKVVSSHSMRLYPTIFGVQTSPQLQLVQGVLQMGANADKELWIDNLSSTEATGLLNSINDGTAPVNSNDYSDSWVHGIIKMIVKQGSMNHNGAYGPNYNEFPVGSATHPQIVRIATNVFGDRWINVKFIPGTTTLPNPAQCFVNENSNGPDYGAVNNLVNHGYWSIEPHVPLLNNYQANVTLIARGYTNGNNPNPSMNYGLVKRTNNASPWLGAGNDNNNVAQNTGIHLNADQSEAGNVITCKRNFINSFSEFAIGIKGNTPLPVKWLTFDVNRNGMDVNIKWTTDLEVNCDKYIVQRSTDAVNYTDIIELNARNTNTVNEYNAADKNNFPMCYYRIKQTDIDGKYSYSSVKYVSKELTHEVSVYPNPATEFVYVQLKNALETNVSIYSLEGKLLWQQIITQSEKINLDKLPAGNYVLRVNNANENASFKIMKN